MGTTFLKHYGIPGMKWGVKRFQNEDGTLTDAGKARYSSNGHRLDPKDMSSKDLDDANNRFSKESTYYNNIGHPERQEGFQKRAITRATATFLATIAATSAMTIVNNAIRDENQRLHGTDLVKRIAANAAVAGTLEAIAVYSGSYGGRMKTDTPFDKNNKKQNKKDDDGNDND